MHSVAQCSVIGSSEHSVLHCRVTCTYWHRSEGRNRPEVRAAAGETGPQGCGVGYGAQNGANSWFLAWQGPNQGPRQTPNGPGWVLRGRKPGPKFPHCVFPATQCTGPGGRWHWSGPALACNFGAGTLPLRKRVPIGSPPPPLLPIRTAVPKTRTFWALVLVATACLPHPWDLKRINLGTRLALEPSHIGQPLPPTPP